MQVFVRYGSRNDRNNVYPVHDLKPQWTVTSSA